MSASLNDKLAAYFLARPNAWIDGKELATIAGGYGWRTRVSDLRKRGMTIENRQRTKTIAQPYISGELACWKISEYRYVPAVSQPSTSGPHDINGFSLR